MTDSAKTIATSAGITPRTNRFVLTDEYGLPYDGGRSEHVLAAICRPDKTPNLSRRTHLIANAVFKSFTTGRMSIGLALRVREQYTPYQLCGLVATISEKFEGEPTIGELADFWINAHAEEL